MGLEWRPPASGISMIAAIRRLRHSRHCPCPRFSLCARHRFCEGHSMADHTPTGPVEMGAEMDYAEHDKTYHRFLTLAKYGSLVCVAAAGGDGVRLLHDRRLLLGDRSLHPHLRSRLLPAPLAPAVRGSHGVGRGRRWRPETFRPIRGISVGTDSFHSEGNRRERAARGGLARHGQAHGRARLRGDRRSRRGRAVAHAGRGLRQCGRSDRHGRAMRRAPMWC